MLLPSHWSLANLAGEFPYLSYQAAKMAWRELGFFASAACSVGQSLGYEVGVDPSILHILQDFEHDVAAMQQPGEASDRTVPGIRDRPKQNHRPNSMMQSWSIPLQRARAS